MRFNRKGLEPISIVGSLVVVALMILIISVGPIKLIAQVSWFFGSCWGGKLVEEKDLSNYPEGQWQVVYSGLPTLYASSEDKNKICVIPVTEEAKKQKVDEGQDVGDKEKIELIVTLDDSITPLKHSQSIPVNAYQQYTLNIQIKGLKDAVDTKTPVQACTLRIIDPQDPSETPYTFTQAEGEQYFTLQLAEPKDTFLPCVNLADFSFKFLLEEQPIDRKKYQLQIIVHSDQLNTQSDPEDRKTDSPVARLYVGLAVQNAIQIKINPEDWSAKTAATYTCKIPCTDVTLGLASIQQSLFKNARGEEISDSERDKIVYEHCQAFLENTALGGKTKTIHTLPEGISIFTTSSFSPQETPLRSDLGTNTRTFFIDAQTLKQDFERKPPYQTRAIVDIEGKLILDDYLCFQFQVGKNTLLKPYRNPLLLDAQPPVLTAKDTYFQYHTEQGLLTSQTSIQSNRKSAGSDLVIPASACDDHGGSGCTSYFYYYQGVQFNLPVDKQADFLTKLIGIGMNEAFNRLYTSSLTDVTCQPSTTGSYKSVSGFKPGEAATLLVNQAGAGYICLYAQDQAGNKGTPTLVKYLDPYNLVQQAKNVA